MKSCITCQRVKPLADFYPHPRMADGHLNKCKECQKIASKIARAANLAHYREHDRQRGDLPHRRAAVAAYRETDRGKERLNAGKYAWIDRNPEKRKVHNLVSNAIRDGRLIRGTCRFCGSKDAHAHHNDYSKPFDIWWLCRTCHRTYHRPSHQE